MPFKVRITEDQPVDLYFVMDLSHSMEVYRQNLAAAATSIATAIANTTSRYRLGFGSFSDKPTAPFSG